MSGIHPIEAESYRIMASRVDLGRWPPGAREVVGRMIHATADETLPDDARVGDDAVGAAVDALRARAVVVCDARMVVAGISGPLDARCLLDEVPVAPPGGTRSAEAVRIAAQRWPRNALWVFGNAPTALAMLTELHGAGEVEPAAVIGVPVGYVGATEAKAALWAGPLSRISITVLGRRGGSPIAAAVINALSRLAG